MVMNATVHATIPVTDLERAKRFYGNTLGLKAVPFSAPGHAMFECGAGTSLVIYQRGASKADHTLADFTVANLDNTMNELRRKGVTFEEYNLPGLKTNRGVAVIGGVRGCWFKDPDGNILGITQT